MSKNNISRTLSKLGIKNNQQGCSNGSEWFGSGSKIDSFSPVDGSKLGNVSTGTKKDYEKLINDAQNAFLSFRKIPAPKRGELVRQLGNKIRDNKAELGELVSFEMGKSLQEGLGEVQEMIDICDFAVGLSRQLYGLTMHSERPNWSIVCQKLITDVLKENKIDNGVSCLINGDSSVGKWMSEDKRINLLSATGSTRMGKDVAQKVGARLGKSLLELGGNNAIIVTPSVDIKQAVINIVFGAVGTCGQRCTSTRRIIVHESIISEIKTELAKAYKQLNYLYISVVSSKDCYNIIKLLMRI